MIKLWNNLRFLLLPFSLIYFLFYLIDRTIKKTFKKTSNIPVISIGNITTGGTGKTPVTILLSKITRPLNPIILTRGYHSGMKKTVLDPVKKGGVSYDEPGQLVRNTHCPVSINPSRYQGIVQALKKYPRTGLFIIDDGFQHYQLERDLDIILIDCMNPFGNNLLLPAGNLREPTASLKRADLIVLTHTEAVNHMTLSSIITNLIRQGIKKDFIFTSKIVIEGLFSDNNLKISTNVSNKIRESPVTAFAGVGNFDSFRNTVQNHFKGKKNITFLRFPDHADYTREKARKELLEAAKKSILVTTEKDISKTGHLGVPCYYLKINVKIDDEERFKKEVLTSIKKTSR